ncbi:MAG: hypothetical protein QG608_1921 [Actinomycetota bacterium]|nr:hypothetical protein [Actinomycetota bacterium]
MWKEHSRELPRISAVADDFAAHLRKLGIQPKGQLTQASDSSDPDIGHFGFRSDPTDLRIRSALAGALAPSLSEKCREKMVQKQGQKTMRLVANHAVMQAWILHVLGVSRSEPMDTQTRTALHTVLTESKESQAQWFRTTASTTRSCRL